MDLILGIAFVFGSNIILLGRANGCCSPLGLMTGNVQDWQIGVSSAVDSSKDPGCHVRYARIFQPNGRAWCAGKRAAMEWIQVDLGVAATVTGMMTQGRGDGKQWVTSYMLAHSLDAFHWKYCSDVYSSRKVFKGNSDSHSIQTAYLDQNVTARFVRLYVLEWHQHPSMRIEILGCQGSLPFFSASSVHSVLPGDGWHKIGRNGGGGLIKPTRNGSDEAIEEEEDAPVYDCNAIISVPPQAQLSASCSRPWSKQGTCTPEDAHIYSHGGWCAKKNDGRQWLQIDLGPPTTITGIVTKGRGDSRKKQWVTSFSLSYSNFTDRWYFYKDDNGLNPKEFGGNMDKNTERRHYFNQPFVARYVRVHPITWKGRVSMRLGLIGCPQKGECGPGFFRVHAGSECGNGRAQFHSETGNNGHTEFDKSALIEELDISCSKLENLAFKKDTWVNDKRHSWIGWKDGHSSYAVDGDEDTHLKRCAILDNYYVDYPVWMVDLGSTQQVKGVVITTWQGKGEDRSNVYRDYLYNLEKLTVFVENKSRLESSTSGSKCASISRINNALFRRTLHFECPSHLRGRYVYVKAYGVPSRWNRLYSAILCEVRVY